MQQESLTFVMRAKLKSTASSAQCGKTKSRLLFSIRIKCASILKVKWYFNVKRAKGNVLSSHAHLFNQIMPTILKSVDIQDKDSANYLTTLKTNRWYMRIFFWCLDQIVFGVWLIVMNCGVQQIDWQKYHQKNGGFDFQIDLGLQLIDMGI
jgi:hypothetical protein